jgi:hypothetical protein
MRTEHSRSRFQLTFISSAVKSLETTPAESCDSIPSSWGSVGPWKVKFGGAYIFFLVRVQYQAIYTSLRMNKCSGAMEYA